MSMKRYDIYEYDFPLLVGKVWPLVYLTWLFPIFVTFQVHLTLYVQA